MTSTPRTPVQPAAPQCLNPACHAHNAHPTTRQPAVQPQPTVPARVQQGPQQTMITLANGRQFNINNAKNWIIGILIFLLVGMGGLLADRVSEVAVLKATTTHGQTSDTPGARLDYATKICKITHSKATYAQCVINIVGH